MKKSSSYLLIATAIAGLNLSAHAQFLINNGNASDANTRAGSYGSNGYSGERPINSATVNGNQIVTGNVTGGRALQTNPGYFAPGQLETSTGDEQFQNFVRDSVGVPSPYQQNAPSYTNTQAFYGGSTTAAPPSGFTRDSTTGAYVPVTPQGPQMGYDTRIGLLNPAGLSPADAGLASGQTVIPQTTAVSGAELNGPKYNLPDDANNNSPFFNAYKQWNTQDRQQLSQSSLEQMRAELNQSNSESTAASTAPPGVTPGSLSPQSVSPQAIGTQPNSSNSPSQASNTAAQGQQNPALLTPTQQSAQYAELQQRFQQFQNSGANPSANPSPFPDVTQQGGTAAPAESTPEDKARVRADLYPPSVASSPLLIHSLAVGIHAKGLREVMADAEQHMRQGHFSEAMLRYAAAAEVAPNNPLVPLGRSFAELGAGYYARADRDLREALQTDPVLLMGRYDLKNLLSQSRLEFVVRDLKQIAVSDKQNADAPFLLGYIAYNTGSVSAAGQYLDLAEQRSTGHPAIFGLMRQYWGLSTPKK